MIICKSCAIQCHKGHNLLPTFLPAHFCRCVHSDPNKKFDGLKSSDEHKLIRNNEFKQADNLASGNYHLRTIYEKCQHY